MEDTPYNEEEFKELKVWLNKPYKAGEVHLPDSVRVKIHRLIATVERLNRYNNLVEEEVTSLKKERLQSSTWLNNFHQLLKEDNIKLKSILE